MDQQTPSQEIPRPLRGKTVAVFFGVSVSLLTIGILNYLSEVSKSAKTFLIFAKALGPWSGKVSLGYLAGLIAWFCAWLILRKRDGNIIIWFWIFFASVGMAILLVFTPFLHLLI